MRAIRLLVYEGSEESLRAHMEKCSVKGRTRLKDLFELIWDFDPKHLTVEFVGDDDEDGKDTADA